MAKYSNTVEYQIRTTLDSSGITKLRSELSSLQNMLTSRQAEGGFFTQSTINKTLADIKKIDNALTQAFNGKLGMLDTKKFVNELTAGGRTIGSYYETFAKLGPQGVHAFGQMYTQLTKIDTGMKQVSSTTDKIMNTFGNTFRWGMIASIFSNIMNSFHQSVQYVKDLDNSLTQIMMVSGISRDNMNQFAVQANEAAKILGGTTVQMTEATKVFIQQGFNLEESAQLGSYAVHLANVSEQDSATASDEITAYMNAFKIPLEDLGNAISKWAAVANATAVDVEELSIASQKAASVAATVGVDLDQFAGHIAAIESVTREAPENIGNGLKTIYSRIADISLGKDLEDGVNLGSFAKALEKVGVDVLDSTGQLRDAGDILEDTMRVWQDLNQTQRAAVAKTVAGRFQLARFEALMNRADIYENAVNISRAETGTVTYDRMQETYKNSLEGRLNTLTATIQGIFTKAFNTDDFYGLIDAATKLAEVFDDLIQSIGGGSNALLGLGAILTKVFSNQIAQGIGNMTLNRQTNAMAKSNINFAAAEGRRRAQGMGLNTDNAFFNKMDKDISNAQQYIGSFSQEQLDNFINKARDYSQAAVNATNTQQEFKNALNASETAIRVAGVTLDDTTISEERYKQVLEKVKQAEADGVPYIAEQDEVYVNLIEDINKVATELVNLADKLEKNSKALQEGDINLEEFKNQASHINNVIKELTESHVLATEVEEEFAKVSLVLTDIEEGRVTSTEQLNAALDAAGLSMRQYIDGLQKAVTEGNNQIKSLEQTKLNADQARQAFELLHQEMMGIGEIGMAQSLTKSVTSIASGAMSAVFAIQSLSNAITALSNDDLNPFEKLEQGIMGLSMGIAMFAPTFSQFRGWLEQGRQDVLAMANATQVQGKAFTGVQAIIATNVLDHQALTSAKIKDIAATNNLTEATVRQEIANMGLATANEKVTLSENLKLKSERLGIQLSNTAIGKTLLNIAAKMGLITADEALAAAETEVGAAALFAEKGLAGLVPFAAPILAIAAGIAVLVGAIKLAYNAYTADARAAQEAHETATQLNKTWQDSKTAVDELKSSLEELENAEDTLDHLTIGTKEWNEALKENNDLVLELMSNYPELAKYVTRTEGGRLEISTSGKQAVTTALENREKAARIANYGGQIAYNQAALRSAETDISREKGLSDQVWATSKNLDAIANVMIEQNKSVNQLTAEDIAKATGFSGGLSHSILDEIQNNGEKLERIANQKQGADVANKILYDEMMKAQLGDQYNPDSPYAQQMFDQYMQQRDYLTGIGAYKNMGQRAAAEQYAEIMGFDKNSIRIDGDAIYIKGADGKEGEPLTQQEIESSLLNYAAAGITRVGQGNLQDFEPYNQYKEYEKTYGQDIANILKYDKNGNIIKGEFDFSRSTQYDVDKLSEMEKPDWITPEALQAMGYDDWNEYISALKDAAAKEPLEVELEVNSMARSEGEINEILKQAGLDPEELDTYVENFVSSGKAGKQQDEINTLLEHRLDVTKKLAKTTADWEKENDPDKKEHLKEVLDELNQELDGYNDRIQSLAIDSLETDNAIKTLTDSWEDWNTAINSGDIAKSTAAYGDMKNVLAGLLNIDVSSISDEFIQSPKVLRELNNLANGDVEALDRIRAIAAEPIIQKIAIDNNLDDDTINDLTGWVNKAQKELPNLEVGATLDDGPFVDGINNMIRTGQIGANKVNQIFEGIGYDVNVEYVPAKFDSVKAAMNSIPIDPSNLLAGMTNKIVAAVQWLKNGGVVSKVPKLTFTKKGKGGYKGSPGGSGGSGGGGGGGSSKTYTPKEKDRYEKVNTSLQKIDSSLNNINKDKDRLISTRWLDNLEKETNLLKQQVPLYQEKLGIQEDELDELQGSLESLAKDLKITAKFDTEGQLLNYSEIFDAVEKARKQAYKSGDEAAIDAAEKMFSDFEKTYTRYDTLWASEIPATKLAIKELKQQMEDIAEAARAARHEAAQELDDLREQYEDFNKTLDNMFGDHLEVDINYNLNRLSDIIGTPQDEEAIRKQIEKYEQMFADSTDETQKHWWRNQIDNMTAVLNNGSSVYDLQKQNLVNVMKMLDDYQKTGTYQLVGADGQIIDSTNEVALKEIFEETLKGFTEFASSAGDAISGAFENMDKIIDIMDNDLESATNHYEDINDEIEHMLDMNELLYGDEIQNDQVRLYQMQAQTYQGQLEALAAAQRENDKIIEQYRTLLASDEKNLDYQQKLQEALEKQRDLNQQNLDLMQQYVQALKDAKETANELAVQDWLGNFKGTIGDIDTIPFEYMADQWERIQENEQLYLDDLNKVYEIQKLQNKYQEMLNNATDPTIQQQITNQMNQQLKYLREKDQLSQYDVEYANAQLGILQKTIALEDAREAKNQMKLRRDSQGNYQYVYAEDRNNTLQAQNELLEATMNAYNLTKERQAEVQDEMYNKIRDLSESIRNVMNDETLTAAEANAIIQDIIDKGYEYLDSMSEQFGTSQQQMMIEFLKSAEKISTENIGQVKDIAEQLKDGTLNTLQAVDERFDTSIKTWIEDNDLFRDDIDLTREKIVENIQDFEQQVDHLKDKISDDVAELEEQLVATINEINTQLSTSLEDNTKLFNQVAEAVMFYRDKIQEIREELDKLDDNSGLKALQEFMISLLGGDTQLGISTKLDIGKSVKLKSTGKTATITGLNKENNTVHIVNKKEGIDQDVLLSELQGFATGGYTGRWNDIDDGRLAILHQKELVLNEEDTQNILAAVDIVRQITQQIKQSGFSTTLPAFSQAMHGNVQGSNIEQRVEITATFPNVRSAQEIEEALLSLSDTSYQYAYNKNDIPW